MGGVFFFFPEAASGFNLLTDEEKKKLRKKVFAKFVFKVFFVTGVMIILADCIFSWLKVSYLNYVLHPILYILMVVILFIGSNRYIDRD